MSTHYIELPNPALAGYLNVETEVYTLAEVHRILEADRKRRGEPVAWHTEDHLTDKSATTYDPVVAERWLAKGWPVSPLFQAPQPAEPVKDDDEGDMLTIAYMSGYHEGKKASEAEPVKVPSDAEAELLDYAMAIAHERELCVLDHKHDSDAAIERFRAAVRRLLPNTQSLPSDAELLKFIGSLPSSLSVPEMCRALLDRYGHKEQT